MASPAPRPIMTLAPSADDGPAGMLPFALLARTSTRDLQDPASSLRRQDRNCQDKLPPGGRIVARFWDIESGGLDLDQRGHGDAWQQYAGIGLPRDGGLADLLAEAAGGAPRFCAVICEDIERSARDTLAALQLEKQLAACGIPLFAADEPITVEGINANTVLLRRIRQGVAEFFRWQIKKKCWDGLVQHSIEGWNIGTAPYGYRAVRVPHPAPAKASQGRTKTRLALDPATAPIVEQMFTWRTVHKLGGPAIAAKLNAAGHPAPDGAAGWTAQAVLAILGNPKYTGHMVYGRTRTVGGRRRRVPPAEWFWSPEPVHPAIIDRAVWEEAQGIGAGHRTSRDGTGMSTHPAATRFYPYRGRCFCKDCQRRMGGSTYGPRAQSTYYRCPHNPKNPRHAATRPDHPATVQAPETQLDQLTGMFLRDHLFGPERAALLAAQLPATDADAAATLEADKAVLRTRIRQNEAAKNAQILAQEQLPPGHDAADEMRARIFQRYTELRADGQQLQAQLDTLDATTPRAADTTLLDELPLLGDILPGLPPRLKAELFDAVDLHIWWNKPGGQVTLHAELTEATLHALTFLQDPSHDGYHDTHPAADPDPMCHLGNAPIAGTL